MDSKLKLAGSFVERHGGWSDEQVGHAHELIKAIERDGLEVIRFAFVDQHGLMRGKAVHGDAVATMMTDGCAIVSTLILKDTAHRTIMPVWQAGGGMGTQRLAGAADLVMVPDSTTFRRLPWAPSNGWVLCDLYYPDGEPVAYSTRHVLREALKRLARHNVEFASGLELEFHLYRLADRNLSPHDCVQPATPPAVSLLQHGYQYLTEIRYDEIEPLFEKLRRGLKALGLPLRSEEIEFGPSQFELTFGVGRGMETADNAAIAKNAIKQICQREGYHATFMCRPHIANSFASGWHLHQSLVDKASGRNCFAADGTDPLSAIGMSYLAGLLSHARESCILAAPTVNAYKRYKPGSLAPDRIQWGHDNKGAMLRVIGGTSSAATRIENRIGDPAANPYLYLASQILSGVDGIEKELQPPSPVEEPYASDAERLPKSLEEALNAFEASSFYRTMLGDGFVDYFAAIKRAEVDRFLSEVTDWEQREYFEMF